MIFGILFYFGLQCSPSGGCMQGTAGGLQQGPACRPLLQHRALAVSAQSGRTSTRGAQQPDQARTSPGFLYGDSLESWQQLI